MKLPVFISWSGDRSKAVAKALAEWLPQVIQAVDPWLSTETPSGKVWFATIGAKLQTSNFGIICVTAENRAAPWLNFEAGACAKMLTEANCCPYLLGLEPAELEPPLGEFQAKRATKEDTRDLVSDINKALGVDAAVKESALPKVFERSWPDLETSLRAIPSNPAEKTKRLPADMIPEILEIVRGIRQTGTGVTLAEIAAMFQERSGFGPFSPYNLYPGPGRPSRILTGTSEVFPPLQTEPTGVPGATGPVGPESGKEKETKGQGPT